MLRLMLGRCQLNSAALEQACRLIKVDTVNNKYLICFKRLMTSLSGTMKTSKDPSLADEAVHIEISELTPRQNITVHASVRLPNSSILESFAHYVTDADGCVSLERHESLGGDYRGIQPMGPLSFMKPSPINKKKFARFLIKDPIKPFKIDFRLFNGFLQSLEDTAAKNRFEGKPNLTITRTYMNPGVKEIPVSHGNVRATLYIPPGKGPFPGIISLSGGYPGALKYKAALLASHGFAAIALKYFGEDDLKNDFFNVDMEYIEEAVNFLRNHPMVDAADGIGIIANCYGGVIALAAASVLPRGLIRCVATVNAWPFPMGEITYKGKYILPGVQPLLFSDISDDGIRTWKFYHSMNTDCLDSVRSSSMKIFDRHDMSYMFISGEEDGYLPSAMLSNVTKRLLEDSNHPDFEILYYKGAGHLIEHSYYPLANIGWTFGEPHILGGMQPNHSIAQVESWQKILNFVQEKLL